MPTTQHKWMRYRQAGARRGRGGRCLMSIQHVHYWFGVLLLKCGWCLCAEATCVRVYWGCLLPPPACWVPAAVCCCCSDHPLHCL